MEAIVSLDQLDLNKLYTYADYLSWQFEERVELIKGKPYFLPTPWTNHQIVVANLLVALANALDRGQQEVCLSPFDVRLPRGAGGNANTVIQPDLFVVRDSAILDEAGCDGLPDFIIEILDEATFQKDTEIKFDLYQELGVPEYWIVYPAERKIFQYALNANGHFMSVSAVSGNESITSVIFPELSISLEDAFHKVDFWKKYK